jgi:hypothetical protein
MPATMMKHELNKKQLNLLFSMAKAEYVDSDAGVLDAQENFARCWIKAVNQLLQLDLDLSFPEKPLPEPDDIY